MEVADRYKKTLKCIIKFLEFIVTLIFYEIKINVLRYIWGYTHYTPIPYEESG